MRYTLGKFSIYFIFFFFLIFQKSTCGGRAIESDFTSRRAGAAPRADNGSAITAAEEEADARSRVLKKKMKKKIGEVCCKEAEIKVISYYISIEVIGRKGRREQQKQEP